MNDKTMPAQGPVDANVRGWISVDEALPEPFSRAIKKFQGILAFVPSDTNIYGGQQMILFYGQFEWMAEDGMAEEGDDEGMIKKFGWHYERDSEGQYDSLIFDMNGKVSHWMPLLEAPNA